MKTLVKFIVFLLAIILGISCEKQENLSKDPVIIQLNEKGQKLVSSSASFGIDLFVAAKSTDANSNLMISPYSVALALAMTYNGAEGETKLAIENALRLNGLTKEEININFKQISDALLKVDSKIDFSIANSIWYRNDFSVLPAFIDVNQYYYNAEVTSLDFDDPGSVDIINQWVNEMTKGKITGIIDEIDPQTVMYLMDAIYFKAPWKYQFDKSNNIDYSFQLSDGTSRRVEMMSQTADFAWYSNSTFSMVEMLYGQGNWAMDLLLPNQDKHLDDIINQLSGDNWNSWVASLGTPRELQLTLPPFKFDYDLKLNDLLSGMGMSVAFNPDEADFSGITNMYQLYISNVQHKTFIEVNEEGTEAAAVTSVEVGYTSIGPSLVFNRPFLFVIREVTSGTILFIGTLENPTQ